MALKPELCILNSSKATKPDTVRLVKETVDLQDKIQLLMHEHQQKEVMHLLDLLQDKGIQSTMGCIPVDSAMFQ